MTSTIQRLGSVVIRPILSYKRYPQHIVGYPHLTPVPDLIRVLLQKDKVTLTTERESKLDYWEWPRSAAWVHTNW